MSKWRFLETREQRAMRDACEAEAVRRVVAMKLPAGGGIFSIMVESTAAALWAEAKAASATVPSGTAEFVAALFIKPDLREHALGCKAEDFACNTRRFGRRLAIFLYYWDVARGLGPFAWTCLKRAGVFGFLADLYRRIGSF